jgi:hypothetical protein
VLQLSELWALVIMLATLMRLTSSYDHMHPPPSQAVVDKVYWDNNDYRQMQIESVVAAVQAFEGCGQSTSAVHE